MRIHPKLKNTCITMISIDYKKEEVSAVAGKGDEMSAKITALNHLNKIVGFDAHNSSGYIIRLIVDKGERARLLDEINICQNILKECFENGCIDEGLRLNGVINHACGVLATATNYNGVQVA